MRVHWKMPRVSRECFIELFREPRAPRQDYTLRPATTYVVGKTLITPRRLFRSISAARDSVRPRLPQRAARQLKSFRSVEKSISADLSLSEARLLRIRDLRSPIKR